RPDEAGKVVVRVGLGIVLVGLETVGVLRGSRDEVLAPRVITIGPGTVGERRAPDVAAGRLVKVPPVVLAEVIPQESLVDLLDDREEAPVGGAKRQLRIRVPRRRDIGYAEQAPGQRLAHLRRVVVHRLEIDPGHSGQAVVVPRGIENYPPGPLWRAQGAVPGVFQGEGLR